MPRQERLGRHAHLAPHWKGRSRRGVHVRVGRHHEPRGPLRRGHRPRGRVFVDRQEPQAQEGARRREVRRSLWGRGRRLRQDLRERRPDALRVLARRARDVPEMPVGLCQRGRDRPLHEGVRGGQDMPGCGLTCVDDLGPACVARPRRESLATPARHPLSLRGACRRCSSAPARGWRTS